MCWGCFPFMFCVSVCESCIKNNENIYPHVREQPIVAKEPSKLHVNGDVVNSYVNLSFTEDEISEQPKAREVMIVEEQNIKQCTTNEEPQAKEVIMTEEQNKNESTRNEQAKKVINVEEQNVKQCTTNEQPKAKEVTIDEEQNKNQCTINDSTSDGITNHNISESNATLELNQEVISFPSTDCNTFTPQTNELVNVEDETSTSAMHQINSANSTKEDNTNETQNHMNNNQSSCVHKQIPTCSTCHNIAGSDNINLQHSALYNPDILNVAVTYFVKSVIPEAITLCTPLPLAVMQIILTSNNITLVPEQLYQSICSVYNAWGMNFDYQATYKELCSNLGRIIYYTGPEGTECYQVRY